MGPPRVTIFQARPMDSQLDLDLGNFEVMTTPQTHCRWGGMLGLQRCLWQMVCVHWPTRENQDQGFLRWTSHCSDVSNVIHVKPQWS